MPRHLLTAAEQAAGVRAALRSKRTPRHFRPALRRRLHQLEKDIPKLGKKRSRPPKFVGWLKL
jgi:hypothetical protein